MSAERYNPVLAGDQPIVMEHIRPFPVFHAIEDRGNNDLPDEDGLQFFALDLPVLLHCVGKPNPLFHKNTRTDADHTSVSGHAALNRHVA